MMRKNRPRSRTKGKAARAVGAVSGKTVPAGFNTVKVKNLSGQADVELDRLQYETTSAFTATGGAASFLQIKGNSVYRPFPGNTDSCGGYSRMFGQYNNGGVYGSKISVRLWSATGTASQEPFRLVVVPCTAAQYAVYSAYTNIAQLRDVPHSREALFSPGGSLPTIRSQGTNANLLLGDAKEKGFEVVNTGFWTTTGADPTNIWYYLVGLQCMAGTTTLNCQAQFTITYDVKWRQPIGMAVQVTRRNFWGNEEVPPEVKKVATSLQAHAAITESSAERVKGIEALFLDSEDELLLEEFLAWKKRASVLSQLEQKGRAGESKEKPMRP